MSQKVSPFSPSSPADVQAAANFFEKVMDQFDAHPVAKGVVVGVAAATTAAVIIIRQHTKSIIEVMNAANGTNNQT